ncbi:transposase [Aquibacillus kalidii]|uniref:transposase n=1 Tax=Aquibacillus kalidii TaxID=2762597 RepID=UPI001645FC6C|nr:transposase [Aquibacillus kalidii]
MARNIRLWIPNFYYHVVCRGNRREPLYHDEDDYAVFLYILEQTNKKFPFDIASYCLMNNHFHLQMKAKEHPISKIMAIINKRYANYYNSKYELTGHVFEKRFFDKIISDELGMLEVSRYIHLNPVVAGVVDRPEDYYWSSYRFFYPSQVKNTNAVSFLNTEIIFKNYSGTVHDKAASYREFLFKYQDNI